MTEMRKRNLFLHFLFISRKLHIFCRDQRGNDMSHFLENLLCMKIDHHKERSKKRSTNIISIKKLLEIIEEYFKIE